MSLWQLVESLWMLVDACGNCDEISSLLMCKHGQKHRAIRETGRCARFLIAHGIPRGLVGGFPTAIRFTQIVHSPRLGRTTGPYQAGSMRQLPFYIKGLGVAQYKH